MLLEVLAPIAEVEPVYNQAINAPAAPHVGPAATVHDGSRGALVPDGASTMDIPAPG